MQKKTIAREWKLKRTSRIVGTDNVGVQRRTTLVIKKRNTQKRKKEKKDVKFDGVTSYEGRQSKVEVLE